MSSGSAAAAAAAEEAVLGCHDLVETILSALTRRDAAKAAGVCKLFLHAFRSLASQRAPGSRPFLARVLLASSACKTVLDVSSLLDPLAIPPPHPSELVLARTAASRNHWLTALCLAPGAATLHA